MVSVGGQLFGGNVESIIVKAVFDDSGMKTGSKRIVNTVKNLSNHTKQTSTFVNDAGNKWTKLTQKIVKDTKAIRARNQQLKEAVKIAEKEVALAKRRKHGVISSMPESHIVQDSKGRLTAGSRFTTFASGLDEFQKRIKGSQTEIRNIGRGLQEVTTRFTNFDGKVIKTTKKIEQQRSVFQMWALSFLFAGMQIKRTAEMITKSSIDTFMKISQGQTESGRAITGLAANFKFLKFEIGNAIGTALIPLMPILTNIVKSVAAFVQQHPEATFAAIARAFILGTGLFLGGQMVMFANGVFELVKNVGGLETVAKHMTTIGQFAGLGVGFYYAYKTLEDVDKDKLSTTVSEALLSVAGFTAATGKFKAAGGIASIGIGLKIMGEGVDSKNFYDVLAGAFMSIGGGLLLSPFGAVGAAFVTIGVAMKLVGAEKIFQHITAAFTFIMHNIIRIATAGVAKMIRLVDNTINAIVDKYNDIAKLTPGLSKLNITSNIAGSVYGFMESGIRSKEADLISRGILPEGFSSKNSLSDTFGRMFGDYDTYRGFASNAFQSNKQWNDSRIDRLIDAIEENSKWQKEYRLMINGREYRRSPGESVADFMNRLTTELNIARHT